MGSKWSSMSLPLRELIVNFLLYFFSNCLKASDAYLAKSDSLDIDKVGWGILLVLEVEEDLHRWEFVPYLAI